jgi:hypothetical protein
MQSANSIKPGYGNIDISHTSNNPYKDFMGLDAKQWTGNEIFDVKLINRFQSMISKTGAVGDFAKRHKIPTIQPDTVSEANALYSSVKKAIPFRNELGGAKTSEWLDEIINFLGNKSNRDYYSKKIKIKDFAEVKPFQTLPYNALTSKKRNEIREIHSNHSCLIPKF